jgi:hypothetical protein
MRGDASSVVGVRGLAGHARFCSTRGCWNTVRSRRSTTIAKAGRRSHRKRALATWESSRHPKTATAPVANPTGSAGLQSWGTQPSLSAHVSVIGRAECGEVVVKQPNAASHQRLEGDLGKTLSNAKARRLEAANERDKLRMNFPNLRGNRKYAVKWFKWLCSLHFWARSGDGPVKIRPRCRHATIWEPRVGIAVTLTGQ